MTGVDLTENQSGLPSPNPTASYWHREPRLQGHRTTPDLPPEADTVVVGAGITGALASRFLCEAGREVVLLEAREVAWGATGRNGGHCQPNVFSNKPHIAAWELRNYAFLRELIEEEDIPCDWVPTSGVHALYSAPLVALAAQNIETLRRTHPSLAETLSLVTDKAELGELGVRGAEGAVVQQNAASLWPYHLVTHILETLLAGQGKFNLQTRTPVVDIHRHGNSWIVHTPRGQTAARQVLVACNGYTSRVLPVFTNVIVPVQGQVASLTPGWRREEPLGHSYGFLNPEGPPMDDYLVQTKGGTNELVYGGARTLGKNKGWGIFSDDEIDPAVSAHLRKNPNNVLASGEPGKEMPASHEWTGIMGFSADANPWVGEVPTDFLGGKDLFLCGGYTGHGMPAAGLSAKAVVAMMLGEDDIDLPDEFRLTQNRFGKALLYRLDVEDYEELLCAV